VETIDGVVDIVTDVANRTCTFKVPKSDVDYEASLAKFAKTNGKLKDYEIQ
jgi:hypothetical protein